MGAAAGFQAGFNVMNARKQTRANAKARNEELTMQGYSFDNDGNMSVRPNSMGEAEQLQAQEAVQLARDLQNKLLAQSTDSAFEDFSHTGDANYLQKALDSDPKVKESWMKQGVNMLANIDFGGDSNLLKQAGFRSAQYDTEEKRDIVRKNAYKVHDGKKWSIGIANQAAMETGSMNRLGNRRAGKLQENYKNFASLMQGPKGATNTAEGHKYEKQIMAASEKYDLPPNLIAAQMMQESSNDPNALSPKGAGGLMQIMPPTAKDLGVEDVFNPDQAIEGGAKYMSQLLERYNGDVKLALAAYNGGMGNVDKYGGIPPFPETQQYVKKIMGNLDVAERYYQSDAETLSNSLIARYQQATPGVPERKPGSVTDTILEHRRGIANASRGTTNANVDAETDISRDKLQQGNRELQQKDRSLDQKDQDIALDVSAQQIKRDELLVKLQTDGSTAPQKNLNNAADRTDAMLEEFGGEEEFFNTDFSDPKTYNKAYRSINAIEVLTNTELSEAQKKEATELRSLVNLSSNIQNLTGAETGLVDKNLGDLKRYFSDNVKGVAAKTAWAAFRNIYIHAMAGTAQTTHEAKRSSEALGTLGNQLGPALEMFNSSLSTVSSKLESAGLNMNPYSAKVRLGATQDKLAAIRENIEKTIQFTQGLTDVEGNKMNVISTPEEKEQGYSSQDRDAMDAIIGAKQ